MGSQNAAFSRWASFIWTVSLGYTHFVVAIRSSTLPGERCPVAQMPPSFVHLQAKGIWVVTTYQWLLARPLWTTTYGVFLCERKFHLSGKYIGSYCMWIMLWMNVSKNPPSCVAMRLNHSPPPPTAEKHLGTSGTRLHGCVLAFIFVLVFIFTSLVMLSIFQ